MSTNTTRCTACRGQKEFAGLGGIMKKCHHCDGKGSVSAIVATSTESNAIVADMAAAATDEVISAIKRKRPSRAKAKEPETVDMFIAEAIASSSIDSDGKAGRTVIVAPVVDEFTQAVLDEPRMDPLTWQAKYKHINRLFGINPLTQKFDELVSKVQRAEIRAQHAAAQPKIKRTVDMTKSQDVGGDIAESIRGI